MHDIVRDVAIWIASSLEDGSRSHVQSGISLRMILESEHMTSSKRVSFMNNVITALPVSFIRCPHASTLLLQGNHSLDRVPNGFLLAFPFLRVLDLSATGITSLPISLMELKELRALLLCRCSELKNFLKLELLVNYGFWPAAAAAAAPPCDAQLDLLSNLEQLFLGDLDRLSCISEIAGHLGLRFSKLRFIRLEGCLQLKYLLSIGDSTSRLENLQEIMVRTCGELDRLFDYARSSSSQITALNHVIPNLRIVKLKNLPKLESLCRQNESWQRLQQLEVMGCGLIKKLPLTAENVDTIKQIRGEQQWWNRLEWENDGIKSSREKHFSPFDIIY